MLPVGSDGSTARPVTRPEVAVVLGERRRRHRRADRRRADRCPGLGRQRVGRGQVEDAETGVDVIGAGHAQARGRQRLLEAERPTVESAGGPGVVLFWTTSTQVPWASSPAKSRQRHLGVERAEERRAAVLDRGRRVVVEGRVGEVRRCWVPPTSLARTTEASRSPFKS